VKDEIAKLKRLNSALLVMCVLLVAVVVWMALPLAQRLIKSTEPVANDQDIEFPMKLFSDSGRVGL
jgi:hypothetical protein